jgi:hypothetical protein
MHNDLYIIKSEPFMNDETVHNKKKNALRSIENLRTRLRMCGRSPEQWINSSNSRNGKWYRGKFSRGDGPGYLSHSSRAEIESVYILKPIFNPSHLQFH